MPAARRCATPSAAAASPPRVSPARVAATEPHRGLQAGPQRFRDRHGRALCERRVVYPGPGRRGVLPRSEVLRKTSSPVLRRASCSAAAAASTPSKRCGAASPRRSVTQRSGPRLSRPGLRGAARGVRGLGRRRLPRGFTMGLTRSPSAAPCGCVAAAASMPGGAGRARPGTRLHQRAPGGVQRHAHGLQAAPDLRHQRAMRPGEQLQPVPVSGPGLRRRGSAVPGQRNPRGLQRRPNGLQRNQLRGARLQPQPASVPGAPRASG